MAEKKVSVRLVAEGGRRVRAELEGIGDAGAKGFGRLSREMDLANMVAHITMVDDLIKVEKFSTVRSQARASPAPMMSITAMKVAVVWARVKGVEGSSAIKSFIVEKGTPGFKLEHLEHKLGIRASDTGTFVLNNCRIPKSNLLGGDEKKKKTEGFKGVMKTFDNTRPMVAAMALAGLPSVADCRACHGGHPSTVLGFMKGTLP